jgi:hypothetical protein
MLVYSNTITPRLAYIAGFIGKQVNNTPFQLTSSVEDFKQYNGIKINYSSGSIAEEEIWVRPHALLFENDIKEQVISCFTVDGHKAFFKTEGGFPFDIFAASFYLLSRYEEYLPYKKTIYGLYDHENSLAWKEGFLDQPLVNTWTAQLREVIEKKYSIIKRQYSIFNFIPTYDIDMAWSCLHKGWLRNTGGVLKSLLAGKWSEAGERIAVLRKKQSDPFDAYHWMDQLHHHYKLRPYYFFLLAGSTSLYDKNIDPDKKAMQQLIHAHAIHYPVGIHPSWRSGDQPSLLKKEIGTLQAITGVSVHTSRQHYIRFSFPDTFRRLLEHGIRFDFSMGYGSINGFRASVASPFYWYDLAAEKQTDLLFLPFCYMDANSFYEQKYTAEQALDEMRHYYKVVKEVNGTLSMIWHNSFLGTGRSFAGWREAYEQFIKEIS